ncbi:MAG TPA: hypothetical protein VHH73_16660, partial [Verrucomicrobiae bacterium]|nr:hypothetical protein [Verrucomicrobiae bacterium]
DPNVLLEELGRRIAPEGKIRGHWRGPAETALYLYGPSADKMRGQISDFLASYPLSKDARVVTFAPPTEAGDNV